MFNMEYFEDIQSNQEEKATSILSLYDQLHEKKGNCILVYHPLGFWGNSARPGPAHK